MTQPEVEKVVCQLLDSCPTYMDERYLTDVLCREPEITKELEAKLIELIEKYLGYGIEQ